jgi:hypothetical protein
MRRLLDIAAREPVYLGAAVLATVAIADPSPLVMAAAVAWVSWAQRMSSKSKRTAAEDVEIARYVGAVEGQASPPLGPTED